MKGNCSLKCDVIKWWTIAHLRQKSGGVGELGIRFHISTFNPLSFESIYINLCFHQNGLQTNVMKHPDMTRKPNQNKLLTMFVLPKVLAKSNIPYFIIDALKVKYWQFQIKGETGIEHKILILPDRSVNYFLFAFFKTRLERKWH